LTIFTAVLVKCFEVTHDLPTNLVIIRGVMQVTLFAVAVVQGNFFVLPSTAREKILVIIRGFFKGVLFLSNVAAIRLLPLGDVFVIFSTRTVFSSVLLKSSLSSPYYYAQHILKKVWVVLLVCLGAYLYLNTEDSLGDSPGSKDILVIRIPGLQLFSDQTEDDMTVLGVIMAFTNILLDIPINVLTKLCGETTPCVLSFWSGVGGLVIGVGVSIFDCKTNVFSGYYSVYEFCLMLVISACFIMIELVHSQTLTYMPACVINILWLVLIPVAFWLCPKEIPFTYTNIVGLVFILSSVVLVEVMSFSKTTVQTMRGHSYAEIS